MVLYNITVEILRAPTIKLTQARARTRARARAMARDRAMARTTDRPRLRARAMVILGLGLGSVFTFKRPDRFCRRTKFNVTGPFAWQSRCISYSKATFGAARQMQLDQSNSGIHQRDPVHGYT